MAQPPGSSGDGAPSAPPAAPYPPYPHPSYYPYYPFVPPTPRPNRTLIIVIVAAVIVVVVTVVLAAVLYVMVSGLIGGPGGPPVLSGSLGTPTLVAGNATFTVLTISPAYPIASFDFSIAMNGTTGAYSGFGVGGVATPYSVSGATLRVTWTDLGGEALLTGGDPFLVAGNARPLPPQTDFVFRLRYVPTSTILSTSWST